MARLVILIPYYGEWPEWLEFTLRSFSAIPQVRFILISDLKEPPDLPANVSMYCLSLQNFALRVNEILKIRPDIRHPFKLTDFKPALGFIFSDLLEGYSHWGYADLDLVMGDLGGFLSRAAFAGADVWSPSASLFPGHFMVLRNNEKTLNLFRKAVNWERVFSDARCFCFDERLFAGGLDTNLITVQDFTQKRISRHLRVTRLRKNPFFRMAVHASSWVRKQMQEPAMNGGNGTAEVGGEAPNIGGGPAGVGDGTAQVGGGPTGIGSGPTKGNACFDFHSVLSKEIRNGNITAYREQAYMDDVMLLEAGQRDTRLTWKEGRLYGEDREILYYHFQLAKSTGGLSFRHTGQGHFELDIRLQGL